MKAKLFPPATKDELWMAHLTDDNWNLLETKAGGSIMIVQGPLGDYPNAQGWREEPNLITPVCAEIEEASSPGWCRVLAVMNYVPPSQRIPEAKPVVKGEFQPRTLSFNTDSLEAISLIGSAINSLGFWFDRIEFTKSPSRFHFINVRPTVSVTSPEKSA